MEEQKKNPAQGLSESEQVQVRRQKLADLQAAGRDPFTLTKFPQDAYSADLKEEFKDLLWSWFNYVDRMNKWTYTLMPMEVMGQMWPAKNEKTMTKAEQQLCVDAGLYDYEA